MNKDHFWVLVERGSYVATLFLALVEIFEFMASHLYQRFMSGATGNAATLLVAPLLFYGHYA